MRLMIASDLHGSDTHSAKLIGAFEREAPERLILLGDLLYHGPRNDLPEGYDPRKVFERLNLLAGRLLAVRGNCDSEVDQMVLDFPIMADYALVYHAGREIFLTHGHLLGPDNPPQLRPGDALISGHTHVPTWDERVGIWYLNPGSVSLPKQDTPHGYMVLDDAGFTWKTLDGAPYHALALS
ncbi:MAG: phosphodiesterase [Christensenellaceae bacterium]|nr:phosphodiesterase [Christensenellaceae bacterium]MEA5066217.1 phosphodiesterase [Eubacteriales bacterium]MEA5068792.1 phosphodiesterase [Christensenellaceae bacterium]